MSIKRAIISVSNKSGVVEFARKLSELGIELLSTGGTARVLREGGVPVKEIADYTGSPEILDGRVKTLHPKVHAGILARRDVEEHMTTLAQHGISTIDMVVVNLYPFEQTVAKEGVALEEALEQIDIGGPTLVRAAAKNWPYVVVITDPNDYPKVIAEIESAGDVSQKLRQSLAAKAFALTARYDAAIANWLSNWNKDESTFPDRLLLVMKHHAPLRYGENPHQKAAFYVEEPEPEFGLGNIVKHQGKELSFNNIYDMENALALVRNFERPAAVIVKHNNPCGAAEADTLVDAYKRALASDPQSAFGGVVALNRPVNAALANELKAMFLEVVAAPEFEKSALEVLAKKKNLRLVSVPQLARPSGGFDIKRVSGGYLVQERDSVLFEPDKLKVVSKRQPTEAEMQQLLFAWKVVAAVKSNAIVVAKDNATIGVGAGQMSRVDSVKIAISKAHSFNHNTKGAVLASDGFFPFRDSIDEAAKAGITAVIEPGGSVRDEEVIAAADEHGIALVFTGIRHFKH